MFYNDEYWNHEYVNKNWTTEKVYGAKIHFNNELKALANYVKLHQNKTVHKVVCTWMDEIKIKCNK